MPTPKPCEKCGRDYYPLRRGYCHRCDMQRRAKIGYQCSHVDAEPTRLHIKNLQAAGVGIRRISELAGVDRKRIQVILHGRTDRGTAPSRRIAISTSTAIQAVPIPDIAHHVLTGNCRVPAVGTMRRLQSLVAFGYSRTYLAGRLNMQVGNFCRLLNPTTTQINADTARRVEDLFAELEVTPGPSVRARNDGKRKNWKVPMLWDLEDLDRPEATPVVDIAVGAGFCELYQEMRDLGFGHHEIFRRITVKYHDLDDAVGVLTKEGLSAARIAELLGVSDRTVQRRRGNNVRHNSRWLKEDAG